MLFGRRNVILFLLIVLPGCTGVRVSQDYNDGQNLAALKTYAWHYDQQEKSGDIRIDTPLIDQRVRSAIDKTLTARGYRKASRSEADFHIAYQYAIRNQLESDQPRTSIGFGFGSYGRHSSIGISTGTNVNSYDEGLLVIDILDSRDGETLWRGKGTRRVFLHSDPARVTRQINETVHKILDQFPP